MTKITIFSGFLGAGKTTLIKKLIQEGYKGEKLVLIENEFGQIGIDGGFLQDAGVEITEMNSGCICCSLVGDFGKALEKVLADYAPDRILIEPSGVGKLSDVIRAVQNINAHDVELDGFGDAAETAQCVEVVDDEQGLVLPHEAAQAAERDGVVVERVLQDEPVAAKSFDMGELAQVGRRGFVAELAEFRGEATLFDVLERGEAHVLQDGFDVAAGLAAGIGVARGAFAEEVCHLLQKNSSIFFVSASMS